MGGPGMGGGCWGEGHEPGVPGEDDGPPGEEPMDQENGGIGHNYNSNFPPLPPGPGMWGGPERFPHMGGGGFQGFNPVPPQVGNKKKKNKNKNKGVGQAAAAAAAVAAAAATPPPFVQGNELKTSAPPSSEPSGGGAAPPPSRQPESTKPVPNAAEWPPSLKAYVSRCFNKCVTDVDKDQVEIILKGKITKAASENTLWGKNCDEEPLPATLSTDTQAVRPALASPRPSEMARRLG